MTRTTASARLRFEAMAAEYLERMGGRIREAREAKGLTQDDLARKLPGKVTGQRVSLWERGKHRPRDEMLDALAETLGVPVVQFLAATPEKSGTPDLMAATGNGDSDQLDRIESLLMAIAAKLEISTDDLAEQTRQHAEFVAREELAGADTAGTTRALPGPRRRGVA